MPIKLACECGKRYRAPDDAQLDKLRCRACGGTLSVDQSSAKSHPSKMPSSSKSSLSTADAPSAHPTSASTEQHDSAANKKQVWVIVGLCGTVGVLVLGLIITAALRSENPGAETNHDGFPPTVSSIVLLHDPYTVEDNSTDINHASNERQSGTLSPITYNDGGEPVFSQVGNIPNALLMAGRSGGTAGRVSLDHNFVESINPGLVFVIEFEVNPVLEAKAPGWNPFATSWIAFSFGGTLATRHQFPQQHDGMCFLFRGNGEIDVWDHGAAVPSAGLMFAEDVDDQFHRVRIEIRDPSDRQPFDGNGNVSVSLYLNGSDAPAFQHVRAGGFDANYVSVIGEGEGGGGGDVITHGFDSLTISHQPGE